MFLLGVLCTFFIAVSADLKPCYNEVDDACNLVISTNSKNSVFQHCNATYGSMAELQANLQAYANAHIESSYELLLMSTHFGNYEANRDGFKKLYRKLSDKTWEDAINIIKFITKRGGKMNFNQLPRFKGNSKENKKILQLNEILSLSKALDIEKKLAQEALNIHARAQHHPKQDGSVAHYLEEQFMEQQADCVRQLAGHITDLKKLLTDSNAPVSIYLFDEYLKKIA